MLILGIESTCDETAVAIVKDGEHILSNIVSSQIDLHRAYGGVVPELACRRHVDIIIPLVEKALRDAQVINEQIDVIAVAKGPGLIGALLIGLNTAKALALAWNKPFIGVNHIEAHLYAAIMPTLNQVHFPALGVVISGGHTTLVKIQSIGQYELLGQTADDAVGEAFDKIAALLGLPYPGGPAIEQLALDGDSRRYGFKGGVVKTRPLDFSFSGLKTNVLYALKGQNSAKESPIVLPDSEKKHIAASFQHAALSDIVEKTILATQQFSCNAIVVGGGVSNNRYLRKLFQEANLACPIYWPPVGLSVDNAAMIAGLAFHTFQQQGHGDPLDLPATTRIPFTQ